MFLSVSPKFNLYMYDNDVFGVYNFNEFKQPAEITLLGDEYLGFEDIETGQRFTKPVRVNPKPFRKGDSATFRPEPTETVYELPVFTGGYKFFRLLKK